MSFVENFIKVPLRFVRYYSLKSVRNLYESIVGGEEFFPATRVGKPGVNVFFGYYDYSPFSADDQFLLALHASLRNRTPKLDDSVNIVRYSLSDRNKPPAVIGRSTTWCWQMGCRLQWFPRGNSDRILYNRIIDGKYGSVIAHVDSGKIEQEIPQPMYDVSPDGRWGLSLNFSRLNRLRPGYGYVGLPDLTLDDLTPCSDGIWKIDIESGKIDMLFSVADAAQFHSTDTMNGAEHYFNHISINPSGQRYLFVHLWEGAAGRFGRLITCDSDGNNWCLLNNEGHTSHYTWRDTSCILAYATHMGNGIHFYEYQDQTNKRKIIGRTFLNEDGHPSYSPDGQCILIDTYPDRCRNQHLFLYRIGDDSFLCIGRFNSPFAFQRDLRCDLHPRWSCSGNYVCVDVPLKGGFRELCVIDVRQGKQLLNVA